MQNRLEFVTNWFGGLNVGATPAFVNNQLTGKQLLHCLKISDSEFIISDGDDALMEALFDRFTDMYEPRFPAPIPRELGRGQFKSTDPWSIIFTSGTTGLPKACGLTHWSTMKMNTTNFGKGIAGSIHAGGTVAISEKFSASNYWREVYECNAKYIHYIGEMMRYVVEAPESPYDKTHGVRVAAGSQLRYDVWPKLTSRFGDFWVYEIYGSTEGNVQFANILNDEATIIRLTPLIQLTTGTALVKFDPIEEKIIRNEKGFAMKADFDEPGLLVGAIRDDLPFEGYYNDDGKTEEKILRNLFKEGDAYFDTGDLLKMDREYKLTFSDRVGDTYRWKGENVSTLEVANTIGENCEFVHEANVYGIKIPWAEGACGAAAITLKSGKGELTETERQELFDIMTKNMPAYQRPVFVRVQPEIEMTGTFKFRKVELVNEGYDVSKFEDGVSTYFYSKQDKNFIPLTTEMVKNIDSGDLKF
ncbi:Oidioi.mRNA.OKI2018_I69.XSR.g14702.t1.cds [Oikopleura dioica]|uniref:long-chain-fatty-acid--CoA ligase n=1 Tax=Oikopleura dioica TaxID=34765 RepID=A0ABN7SCC9_OIKDI|nr:Oidioi.mRNA.OKI2018_I69.XSR.g14702.t1.cds [Oikopleura dioica]